MLEGKFSVEKKQKFPFLNGQRKDLEAKKKKWHLGVGLGSQ